MVFSNMSMKYELINPSILKWISIINLDWTQSLKSCSLTRVLDKGLARNKVI